MEDWQQRVIDEKASLDGKLELLSGFIGTPDFHALTEESRTLLGLQETAMTEYSEILGKRISLF